MKKSAPLYIKNGNLLLANQKSIKKGDLLLQEGKIHSIAKPGELATKAKSLKAEMVDASGLIVSPGFIDLNCRVYEPGAEQKESFATVSASAAAGGFTSLACLPCGTPVNDNAFMTDFILRRAQENSAVRIFPIGCITQAKEGKKLAEIGLMAKAGVRALSDDGRTIMDTYLMRKALEYAKGFSLPIFASAEDQYLHGQAVMHEGLHSNRLGLRGVPAAAEEIIVARDIILAKHTGGRLHFSAISTSGAVTLIRQAKAEGLSITADTHPHYFTLTADHISTYDANYKVFPPLRMEADVEAIIEGLADGTIDAISSGHFPQSESAKQQVFELAAPGMISLETTLSLSTTLVNKKKISPERMIQLLSTAPAQILGMENEIGSLQVGKWADITIFDPQSKFTYAPEKSKGGCRNSPFYGQKLSGAVRYCIVSGAIVSRGLV